MMWLVWGLVVWTGVSLAVAAAVLAAASLLARRAPAAPAARPRHLKLEATQEGGPRRLARAVPRSDRRDRMVGNTNGHPRRVTAGGAE